jgi:hypothetical protein
MTNTEAFIFGFCLVVAAGLILADLALTVRRRRTFERVQDKWVTWNRVHAAHLDAQLADVPPRTGEVHGLPDELGPARRRAPRLRAPHRRLDPHRAHPQGQAMSAPIGFLDKADVFWRIGTIEEANVLLREHHYLGPMKSGRLVVTGLRDGVPVAAMVWRHPTSRRLPSDGSWLELSRWCLTPAAGDNAGSRMHKFSARLIRASAPRVTTLVSYSDPTQGHTGALYRACNWRWAPTWHRLRTPPSGNGDWGTGPQAVKDRWVFCVRPDDARRELLAVNDAAAVRHWVKNGSAVERGWASRSLNLDHVDQSAEENVA